MRLIQIIIQNPMMNIYRSLKYLLFSLTIKANENTLKQAYGYIIYLIGPKE